MRILAAPLLSLVLLSAPAFAQDVEVDVTTARESVVGRWEGSLEYLDYSANKWFGIPVKTRVEDQGDSATLIRTSDFDDGPKVGNVRITTVELFDAKAGTVSLGTFRKGKPVSVQLYATRLDDASVDRLHWKIIGEATGLDDNRPALLRETTIRDGDGLETLKEVDYLDDDGQVWIIRNRTRLTRVQD
ncbi:MAG: hypothetical protein WBO17_12125 [Sphingorhabdus sp.]